MSVLTFTHIHLPLPLSGVAYMEVRRPCRIMILVNPQSGRGQALQLFTGHIQGMLTEASVPYTLVITGQWSSHTHKYVFPLRSAGNVLKVTSI